MRRVICVLVLLSLAFAPAPLPRRAARPVSDEQRIVGCWAVVSLTIGGKVENGGKMRWSFQEGGRLTIRGMHSYEEWNYALDPRATPPTLTLSGSGEKVSTTYRLVADELSVAYGFSGRPAEAAGVVHRFRREQ